MKFIVPFAIVLLFLYQWARLKRIDQKWSRYTNIWLEYLEQKRLDKGKQKEQISVDSYSFSTGELDERQREAFNLLYFTDKRDRHA